MWWTKTLLRMSRTYDKEIRDETEVGDSNCSQKRSAISVRSETLRHSKIVKSKKSISPKEVRSSIQVLPTEIGSCQCCSQNWCVCTARRLGSHRGLCNGHDSALLCAIVSLDASQVVWAYQAQHANHQAHRIKKLAPERLVAFIHVYPFVCRSCTSDKGTQTPGRDVC